MVKIKMYVDTGFAGCTHEDILEIEEAQWNSYTEEEKDKYLQDCAQTFMSNYIDYGAYVIDEEE